MLPDSFAFEDLKSQELSMDECDGHMMVTGNGVDPPDFEVTLLEPRPFRPFKSSEEYLYAMKEDLAEWLNGLYEGLSLDADNFLEQMETGVILCQHANNVVRKAREYYRYVTFTFLISFVFHCI